MLDLVRMLFLSPWRTVLFSYAFITKCSLLLLRALLLPHVGSYQSLRLRLHRAYLASANLFYPDLVHRLPVSCSAQEARPVEGEKWKGYVIPGSKPISSYTDAKNYCVVLYAHGGGYARGEARMYRKYMRRWRQKAASELGLDLVFLSVEYPLTTEAPHPAQLESFLGAYEYLLSQDIPASKIVFMGDSAGGGLSILAGVDLLKRSRPQPAATVLVSPWIDFSLRAYHGGNALVETDYVVTANALVPALIDMFVGKDSGLTGTSPEVNPLYRQSEELSGLNRQLIIAGGAEFCVMDAKEWTECCSKGKVDHKLIVEWGQMHIFAMGSDWVAPEVRSKTDLAILHWISGSVT